MAQPDPGDRFKAAIGAASLQALLAYALLAGLGASVPAVVERSLKLFAVAPPVPPPPPARRTATHASGNHRPEGGSPPNLRAQPTEIVAPIPAIRLNLPSPVVAAKVAGPGSDASAGAADIPGPGTGSGGSGNGNGNGNGDGDGDGDGGGSPPRHVRGRLRDSDYPREVGDAGIGGTVSVIYQVGVDGRVSDCRVTGSSGSDILDQVTCRLIEQRFRFEPSRDLRGRPVPSHIVENHSWIVHDEPPEEQPR
jgi:protein TonB